MPTDTTDDLPEVELIEASRFQLSEDVTNEPLERTPIVGGTTLVVLAVAVIVVGLVLIPRTVPPPTVNQTPSQTTGTTVPTTSIPDQANGAVSRQGSTTTVTQAIPLFEDGLTPDVPGVLSGIDANGSLITIDRTQVRPEEVRLGMRLADGGPRSTLIVVGAGPTEVAVELSAEGSQIIVNHRDGRFLESSFALAEVAPDLGGTAVLVSHGIESQVAIGVPLSSDGVDRSSLLEWVLPGQGLEVLGIWGDRLVVHQANRVWLLTTALQPTLIGDGQLLAYDGVHLARLVCDEPNQCSLVVGTPDEPETSRVPLPATLAKLSVDDWSGSISVSPDGRRLAASARFGAVSLPVVVDMITGETQSLADGMNRQASVAWSPDGAWLAYVYTNDVMVWNLAEQRSWRIQVNRELETLLWR